VGYSEDEKRTTVQEIVRGTLTFPSDLLGPRDLATDFTEAIELVHTVLLYDPDSVFYLIRLAANGLNQILSAEVSTLNEMLEAIDDLAQPNRPVDSVSGLRTARNALLALESSITRGGALGQTEFRRYSAGMSRIKNELARAVRMTYTPRGSSTTITDVVRPLPEAKAAVVSSFNELKTEHVRLLGAVDQVLAAFSEFEGGKLEVRVAQQQVSRASAQVDDLYELLDPLLPAERTAEARDALLKVLTNEASIKAMADRVSPGQSKLTQLPDPSPDLRIRAYGEGTSPVLVGTNSGPFKLDSVTSSELRFTKLNDAAVPVDVDLLPGAASSVPGVQHADLKGSQVGPFALAPDLVTPYPLISVAGPFTITLNVDDMFYILIDGQMFYKQLTPGVGIAAATLVADLQAAANWTPSLPTDVAFGTSGSSVAVSYTGTTLPYKNRSIEVTQGLRYAASMWSWAGGPAGIIPATQSTGWDDNTVLRLKVNDDPNYFDVDLTATAVSPEGDWPGYLIPASKVASAITAAGISNSELVIGIDSSDRILVRSTVKGEGSIVTVLSDGLRVGPDPRVGFGTPTYLGMKSIGFSDGDEVREYDVDSKAVVNVLNEDTSFSTEAEARLDRTELINSTQGLRFLADTVFAIPFEGDDPTTDWPDYTELKLEISNGDARGIYGLASTYVVLGQNITFVLDRRLRSSDNDLRYTVSVFRERIRIISGDAGLTGTLQLGDPVSSARTILGFDTTEVTATVGEVIVEFYDLVFGWRALDVSRRKIRINDKILAGTWIEQTVVSSVTNTNVGRLGVYPEVTPTLSLDTEGFYIQSAAFLAYQTFVSDLEVWKREVLPPYEENLDLLDTLLAPVLLSVPSKDRVDTVYDAVSFLLDRLTGADNIQDIIEDFGVTAIPAVDTALQTLLDQGYDRTRSLLLSGKFTDFFASTAQDASYARAFQLAVNELAVEDINESAAAKGRWDAEFVRVSAEWEEDIDPERDFTDFEQELPDDPVVDYYVGVNEYEGD
jgi:hypothetical protein